MNTPKIIILIAIIFSSLTLFNDCSYAEEVFLKNELGLYAAGTTNLDSDETAFTLGFDFEHKMKISGKRLGIGLFGEVAFFDEKEFLIGVPFSFYPIKYLAFAVAPGIAFIDTEEGTEEVFLFRMITSYTIDLGSRYFIKPAIALDFIDGDKELVYGAVLGIQF